MIREPFIAADDAYAATDPELSRLKRARRLALFLAIGVLLVCLTTALVVWQAFRLKEAEEFKARFHQQTDRYLHAIQLDLRAKENLLRGAAGFYAASEMVTAREWSRYVSRLNIEPAVSGILAMGYSQRVVPALREYFEAGMRLGGSPTFAISPPGDRPELQAISHVAPTDGPNGNALGLDLLADPVLRRSIERASDTGEIVLSPIVRRLGESNEQSQVVLMIQPVYVDSMALETPEQRTQGFVGFFFLELHVDVMARSALPALDADQHVRMLDTAASPAQELFASDESSLLLHDTIAASHKLPVFGREWTLHFFDHARPGTVLRGSAIVLASGLLGSLLLALLTWRLAASRGQAELLARRITYDLRRSELGLKQSRALLSSVVNGLPSAVLLKNESLEIQLANQAFCELVGCRAVDVIGRRIGRFLDARLVEKLESDDLATLHSGDEQVSELVLPGSSRGESRTYQVRNVRLSGGQPQVLSIYTDITEVRAQSRLIRALIDHLPQRFMVKDRDSRFLLVNSKLAEDVGLTPEAMCGRRDDDFFAAELAQRYRADDRFVIESGQTRTLEEPYLGGWRRTTKAPLRDETGAVIGLVGILDDVTERRAQEVQLREALARFESVFESTQLVAIKSVDRDGIVRRWNPACTALYGIGREDAVGHPLAELIYRVETRPIFDSALARMFETGSGGGLAEWSFALPGGRRVDVYSTMFPVIVGGEVREVFFMDVDISARRQAEVHLRESEARWQFALEGSGDGVWDWDLRNDRVEFSARWKSMLGYTSEEIGNLLDEWTSRVHPDDLPQTMARLRAHLDGRSPDYVDEHRVRCKDGSYLWILDRGKVVERDQHGKPRRMIGTHTDITQRRLAEDRLRNSEMRWQSALEGAGDAVWDWSTVTNKVFLSKRWKEILGYSEAEVGDELDEWLSRVHPDDLPRVLGDLQAHLEGRAEVYRSELRLRRKDGSYLWVHHRGKIVERDADGRPLRVIGRFSDISVRKKAETELARHRDHLSEMVEEQTREVRASRDEAQRANRVKSEFLANMSHELRTPMHAILSFAKLGEARTKKDGLSKLNDYFDRIHVSGDRLLTLLNDLLDLSKLEAGKMVLDLRHQALGRLVREAVREFEAMFQAKGVQLHVHDAVTTPDIPVDTARIGQVLRNLLSNAVKFTPSGRAVEVRVLPCEMPLGRRREDQGRTRQGVEVVVSDEGVGIPESELECVFDKFVQSTKTETGAGGTGLGLAICREIVKAHHGTIFARPNAKGGTDLVVQLPASANAVVSNLFSQG